MLGKVILRLGPGIRAVGTAGALLVLAAGSVGTVGATTTLQELFDDADDFDAVSDGAFTQDGLTFSDFTPLLKNKGDLPSPQNVWDAVSPSLSASSVQQALFDYLTSDSFVTDTISNNPLALSYFNDNFLDFSGNGAFSVAWGNANPASANNIDLTILEDAATTAGVDPGFQLEDQGSEWQVNAGNNASVQLSAFAYTVERLPSSKEIISADLSQISQIAVGPDFLSPLPPWPDNLDLSEIILPDAAAAFTLQFILDEGSTEVSSDPMNYSLESGIRLMPLFDPFSSAADQVYDWTEFSGRDSISVVTIIGLGATSGGAVVMDSLSQRIDPPPPGTPPVSPQGIPESETALLLMLGMLGVGVARRRVKDA